LKFQTPKEVSSVCPTPQNNILHTKRTKQDDVVLALNYYSATAYYCPLGISRAVSVDDYNCSDLDVNRPHRRYRMAIAPVPALADVCYGQCLHHVKHLSQKLWHRPAGVRHVVVA
jgi:hypothetical protein